MTDVKMLLFSQIKIIEISEIIAKNIYMISLEFKIYKVTLALHILNSISNCNWLGILYFSVPANVWTSNYWCPNIGLIVYIKFKNLVNSS